MEKEKKGFFQDMIGGGKLIPTTGTGEDNKNPLEDLSCEEFMKILPGFYRGKYKNDELTTAKIKKHLHKILQRDCKCTFNFRVVPDGFFK